MLPDHPHCAVQSSFTSQRVDVPWELRLREAPNKLGLTHIQRIEHLTMWMFGIQSMPEETHHGQGKVMVIFCMTVISQGNLIAEFWENSELNTLVLTNSSLLNIAIEIVSFSN